MEGEVGIAMIAHKEGLISPEGLAKPCPWKRELSWNLKDDEWKSSKSKGEGEGKAEWIRYAKAT